MNPLVATAWEYPPFDQITEENYPEAIKTGIEKALKEVDDIVSNPEPPSMANTVVALERAGADLTRTLGVFYPMQSALSTPRMMEIAAAMAPLLADYQTRISLNEGLWQRIKTVYDSQPELGVEDSRLLELTYKSFQRSGALLEGETRTEYQRLVSRLTELTTQFGQNVVRELAAHKIWLSPEEMEGLPDHVVALAAMDAEKEGRPGEHLFTLAQPTYMAVQRHGRRRDVRERFYRLYNGRNIQGEWSNLDVVKEIANTRLAIARLLGYKTYADYRLEMRMAHNPEGVYGLLDKLKAAYKEPMRRELKALEEFARLSEGADFKLMPWDYSYYSNLQRKALYDYDEEAMRPYFELEATVKGVFSLAERLYGLKMERVDIPVYHPEVVAYEVKDSEGHPMGLLYTDFFPRDTKKPGAWMTDIREQHHDEDGHDVRPQVSIVMNFTRPVGDRPSLLTPSEVRTLLHETGHALHSLLSRCCYTTLSGTNVFRDFVELPSQFNENFLTQREWLDTFAHHYITGEAIPEDTLQRMKEAETYGAAYACMRQLTFGYLDMAWHTIEQPVSESVEALEECAIAAVSPFAMVEGALISPQFGHIFSGGYAAGYYGYKWAEVLDADAFELFKEKGIFSREAADRLRREILERGGTEDPAVLYRRFRGRDPQIEALLRRDNLTEGSAASRPCSEGEHR
ncbi:MAG: M3 family metallopeptidase [Bacteroidales bacterium]|nr:M3 family metallopeptidase [Bacteroidales bacterium]